MNPRPQDGRRRQNHGAMAATHKCQNIFIQNIEYKQIIEKGGFLAPYDEHIKWLEAQNGSDYKKKARLMEKRLGALAREILDDGMTLHVYFKELGFVKYSTDQLFGTFDIIGNEHTSPQVLLMP